jgi:hypothetical protein
MTITVPEDAKGDARIYGTFQNQMILGYPCTVKIESLPDNDSRIKDILGFSEIRRKMAAIHISGVDPFGKHTGPGFIQAIGFYQIEFKNKTQRKPSGLGCDGPEAALIVTWDQDYHHRWEHHAFFSGADHIVTLGGIYEWWRTTGKGSFGPQEICASIDELRGYTNDSVMSLCNSKQHVRAVRRLLESSLDVNNNHIGSDNNRPILRRIGRWQYEWQSE